MSPKSGGMTLRRPAARRANNPPPIRKPGRRRKTVPKSPWTPTRSSTRAKQSPPSTRRNDEKTAKTLQGTKTSVARTEDVYSDTDVIYMPGKSAKGSENVKSIAASVIKSRKTESPRYNKDSVGENVTEELLEESPPLQSSLDITEEVLDGSKSDEDAHQKFTSNHMKSDGHHKLKPLSPSHNITEEVLEESEPTLDVTSRRETLPLPVRNPKHPENMSLLQSTPSEPIAENQSILATPVPHQPAPRQSPPSIGLHAMKFATDVSVSSDQESPGQPKQQSPRRRESGHSSSSEAGSVSPRRQSHQAAFRKPSSRRRLAARTARQQKNESNTKAPDPPRQAHPPHISPPATTVGKSLGKRPRKLFLQKRISDQNLEDSTKSTPSSVVATPKHSALAAANVNGRDASIEEAILYLDDMILARRKRGRPSRSATKERLELEKQRTQLRKKLLALAAQKHGTPSPPLLRLHNTRRGLSQNNGEESSMAGSESDGEELHSPKRKAQGRVGGTEDIDRCAKEKRPNGVRDVEDMNDAVVLVRSPKRVAVANVRTGGVVALPAQNSTGAVDEKESPLTQKRDDSIMTEGLKLAGEDATTPESKPNSGSFSRFRARRSPTTTTRIHEQLPSPIPRRLLSVSESEHREATAPNDVAEKSQDDDRGAVGNGDIAGNGNGKGNLSEKRMLLSMKQPRQTPRRQRLADATNDDDGGVSSGAGVGEEALRATVFGGKRKERSVDAALSGGDGEERVAQRRRDEGGVSNEKMPHVGPVRDETQGRQSVTVRVALNERSTPLKDVVDDACAGTGGKVGTNGLGSEGMRAAKKALGEGSVKGKSVDKTGVAMQRVSEAAAEAQMKSLGGTLKREQDGANARAESERVRDLEDKVAKLEAELEKRDDEIREKRAAMSGFLSEIKQLEADLERRTGSAAAELERALVRVMELEDVVSARDKEVERLMHGRGVVSEAGAVSSLEEAVVEKTSRMAELEGELDARLADSAPRERQRWGDDDGAVWVQDAVREAGAIRGVLQANRELQRELYAARSAG